MTCAPPACSAPVGISRPSACSLAPGSLPPSEKRIGARSGRGHELRCRDRDAPVARVDERHRARPRVLVARGIDGLRHPGRVGDRVRAADAGRVARGERGEAEVGRGLLLVAALAQDGRLRVAAGIVAAGGIVAAAATAAGEEQRDQGEQDRRAGGGAHGRNASGRRLEARPSGPARAEFASKSPQFREELTVRCRNVGKVDVAWRLRSPRDLVQCPAKPNPRRDSGGRGNQFVGANRDLSVAGRRLFQRQPVS